MSRPDTVIVLAAGQGTRMKTGWAKVMAPLCGRPLIAWVVEQALALEPRRVLVVVGYRAAEVEAAVAQLDPGGRIQCVLQEEQRGTGHAVQCCLPQLGAAQGPVVLLYGDMPLLGAESLRGLCAEQARTANGMALLTSRPRDPRGFGRIVRGADGAVQRIVEEKDADAATRAIDEVNLGVYCFDAARLRDALPTLQPNNAQRELYVTDVVAQFVAAQREVRALVVADEREAIGINTLKHLAEARAALQERILDEHLARGVYIVDPATTYIDHGVTIGATTVVEPCCVIRAGAVIGEGCHVGPFAQIGSDTTLEDGAEIGNFVETKRSRIGVKTKAKHLAYIGDGRIGARCNIGAGTIFANYDGKRKSITTVHDGAFVGSGSVLVAPCEVGAGAYTGAGAVVTRNSVLAPGAVWVGVPARPLEKRGDKNARAAGAPNASGGRGDVREETHGA
jgi:bifunctional UDP-N-acetylglucosamine pyrophosphorylase/glucosamine-1-phosphate N-acetyltransferase